MDPLTILTSISIILLLGVLCSVVGRKLRVPPVLFLVLAGITLQKWPSFSALMQFPPIFLTSMGLLALVIIVFDSTSKLKLKEFDQLSFSAFKLTLLLLALSLSVLTPMMYYLLGVPLGAALVFAALIIGTSPDVALTLIDTTKNRVVEFLKIESIINTPVMVLVPFMIIDFLQSVETKILLERFVEQIQPFLLQVVAGLGSGIFVGLIVFKLMRTAYSEKLSPLALIVSALLAYSLAENLGGNGVLSVTALGVLFGTVAIKEKHTLQEFSGMLTNALEVLVFVLIGLMIDFPLTTSFFLTSLLLFCLFLFIRFVALAVIHPIAHGTLKQYLFMALNCPQGIATATMVFLLTASPLAGIPKILEVTFAFLLYSIILSSLITRFAPYFTKTEQA